MILKFRHIANRYQGTEHIKIYLLIGLISLVFLFYFAAKTYDNIYHSVPVTYGITYSPGYASALGLNPKETYQRMFKDLSIKKIRLSAYWNEIEPNPEEFDFTDLDFYINEAKKNNADVLLAIGYKLPRWPECRVPDWLKGAPIKKRQDEQLKMSSMVIDYYTKINPKSNIKAFQIENEPLLPFGTCDPVDEKFFKEEVAYVRSKTNMSIIITDSGELSSWIIPMQLSDYFGTTMYRVVTNPIIGAIPYPIQPWYYRIKSNLVRKFFAPNNKGTINVELQTEPWAEIFIADIPIDKQIKLLSLQDFKNNVNFAKKTGFSEIYLWGVEWWYWIADRGYPEYLQYAKSLLR